MKNSSTYQLLIAIAVLVIIAGYLYLNPFRGESVPEPYGSEINTEQKITPVQTPQTSTASGEKSDLKAESKAESKAEIDTTTKPEDESTAKPEDKSPQGESSVNTNSEDNTASEESVPEEIADNPLGLGEELTPEKEALLDAQIKKVQEFNEEDWKEPELTEAQKKELQEKQAQADNSRVDKDNFLC